mmetsp:Transcript_29589/g.96705  ORF Transcript_29589/g.96705 Transcript_29589/m.96705 type:complete len:275 (-) Transcript_29589:107-931(-)
MHPRHIHHPNRSTASGSTLASSNSTSSLNVHVLPHSEGGAGSNRPCLILAARCQIHRRCSPCTSKRRLSLTALELLPSPPATNGHEHHEPQHMHSQVPRQVEQRAVAEQRRPAVPRPRVHQRAKQVAQSPRGRQLRPDGGSQHRAERSLCEDLPQTARYAVVRLPHGHDAEQRRHGCRAAVPSAPQCCAESARAHVGVRALPEQLAHDGKMPRLACRRQRSLAVPRGGIDLGSTPQQLADQLQLAACTRHEERQPPSLELSDHLPRARALHREG